MQPRTGFAVPRLASKIARATPTGSSVIGGTKIVSTMSTPGSARTSGMAAAYSRAPAPATMSTGFATDASGTSSLRSASFVASESVASLSPLLTRKSVARIAGPPAFVTMATRPPAGSGCETSACATSNISATESTRSVPVSSSSASVKTGGGE